MSDFFRKTKTMLLMAAAVTAIGTLAHAATSQPEAATTGQNAQTPSGSSADNAMSAAQALIKYYTPSFGNDLPAWAKRIDFDYQLNRFGTPDYTLLTVQPLYQSPGDVDTIFIQGSQLRYDMLGDTRNTTNIGLGYRRLLMDNQLMLGANTFFDREWTYGHERVGIGGEAKWSVLDFYTNGYIPVTGDKSVGAPFEERAMGGWDAELRTPLPYFPWANIGVKHYEWHSHYDDNNINGWIGSLQTDITPNLRMEAGFNSNSNDDEVSDAGRLFVRFTIHAANTLHPVAASTEFMSDKPFNLNRDLKRETLSQVRRENKIVVERKNTSTGAVIISRGN